MWRKKNQTTQEVAYSGIEVSLPELIEVRRQLTPGVIDHFKQRLIRSGQKLTKTRGRGIEFDSTREYQPGDDLRNMAWRVTARSLNPHIKVYREEKERPVWLALDLSPSLYFGTRKMFKSVRSMKHAALIGWLHLLKRERIGAVVAASHKVQVFQPRANERDYLHILSEFSKISKQQPTYDGVSYLHDLLKTVMQRIRSDNLIYIISDFSDFTTENQKMLAHLAHYAQVVMVFVYDPLEAEPPQPNQYFLTNGKEKMLFDMDKHDIRERYQQQFENKKIQLIKFAQQHQIKFQMLCTANEGIF